jgi:outer membrane protein assembly factor BamA
VSRFLALTLAAAACAAGSLAAAAPFWIDRPLLRIETTGLRRTRALVVEREISSRPGERVDWTRLEHDRLRILDTGLFAEVDLRARRDPATDRPILRIDVRERPHLLAYPVLQYDLEDGWSLGAFAATRNLQGLNRTARLLLLGGGRREASVSLGTPWLAGRRLPASARVFVSRTRNRSEEMIETRRGVSLAVTPTRGPELGFPVGGGSEEVRIRPDADVKDPRSDPVVPRTDDHRWVSAGAVYDSRGYRVRPEHGWVVSAALAQHGGILGGDGALARLGLDLLGVFPTGRGTALTAASRLAWSSGRVPRYLRLSLGGGETLRGHDWGAYRGESRWFGWIEERIPLVPKRSFGVLKGRYTIDLALDGALFADAGAVWEGRELEEGRTRARFGAGAGLRLYGPFFEVFNLDAATDGHTVRFYGWAGIRI